MDHLYYPSNLYKAYIKGIMIFENKKDILFHVNRV